MSRFFGIASSVDWRSVTPVEKGWSADRKFRVTTEDGVSLLLRLSDAGQREEKKREFLTELINGCLKPLWRLSHYLLFPSCF